MSTFEPVTQVLTVVATVVVLLTAFLTYRIFALERQVDRHERAMLEAVTQLVRVISASQAWYWTPDWQEGEQEADADLAEGRYTRFSSLEEMDARLAEIPLPYVTNR